MAGFGESLKSARKTQGLTLDQIAQETRITARFLRAIEEEEFSVLPGGLFNRGFIRTYASRLGLDPDEAVSAYQALVGNTPDPLIQLGNSASRDTGKRRAGPIALGGLVVMIVVVWAVQRGELSPADRLPAAQSSSVEQSETAAASTPPTITSPAPRSEDRVALVPDPQEPSLVEASVVPRSEADPVGGAEADVVRGVSVRIQVHEETWVSVQADGQMVTGPWGATLAPGAEESYSADDAMELKIGNAGGVTLNINGHEVPDLGSTAQVRTLNITPDGVGGLSGS